MLESHTPCFESLTKIIENGKKALAEFNSFLEMITGNKISQDTFEEIYKDLKDEKKEFVVLYALEDEGMKLECI